ncbi:hypothetical protein [Ostreiculturibacter nitratireducens]|uniref:hypothetical protein n=1 Tax=Ostreiculturibacter nitratireducens TaxID=3075226 RepID=UPI0031B5DD7F
MRRLLLILALPALLAACGAEPVWAPDEQVTRAIHSTGEAPSITLYTVVRVKSDNGEHSGLMINNSHRVIFDPAGTWKSRYAPERNDVHFGITDQLRDFYIDYHARETYYVVEQTLYVTPEQAEAAMRAAQSYGAVPKAFCGNSVSDILRDVPGFEDIPRSFLPGKIMRAFGKKPGVTERIIRDDDSDSNREVLLRQFATPPT